MNNKVVRATLFIEVFVQCPHCNTLIDVMDSDDTSGYDHNDGGNVIRQACPDGVWIDEHQKFEIKNVKCGDCGGLFDVRGLDW